MLIPVSNLPGFGVLKATRLQGQIISKVVVHILLVETRWILSILEDYCRRNQLIDATGQPDRIFRDEPPAALALAQTVVGISHGSGRVSMSQRFPSASGIRHDAIERVSLARNIDCEA